MKRKQGLVILAVVLTMVGRVFALEGGDSLISQSYFSAWYQKTVDTLMLQEVEPLYQQILEEKQEELESLKRRYVGVEDALVSDSLLPKEFTIGQKIVLEEGSLVIAVEGTQAIAYQGTVLDLTTGSQLSDGFLTLGHQYLVAEDSEATISVQSSMAQLSLQGVYTVSGEEAALEHSFVDVYSTDWYYDAVLFVVQNSLFAGTDETHFSPNMTMDRGMMMTVLYRLAGTPQEEMDVATAYFLDVLEGDWYAPYVRWGFTQKLTVGMGDGYYMPNSQVTRQQIMVMLRCFARDYLQEDVTYQGNLSGYVDVDLTGAWAMDAVTWGVANGLYQGIPDGTTYLHGEAYATRAEVASMLMHFFTKYGKI